MARPPRSISKGSSFCITAVLLKPLPLPVGNDEDNEFLMEMRGWLMTVGTLFVTIAFQAALQPPAWLRTTDFLRFDQFTRDLLNYYFHHPSHAAVAPARFAPSPSPSPQAAESATAGLSDRARVYMYVNYVTFGCSLALVLILMLLPNKPPLAKHFMRLAKGLLAIIALCVVGTVVLGTSEDWRYTPFAVFQIGFLPILFLVAYAIVILPPHIGTAIGNCIARFRALRAERTSAA